jgi:hypothetical protein
VEAAGVEEIGDAAVREGPPKLLLRVHLRLTLAAAPSPATPAAFRAIAAVGVGDASGNSVVPFGAWWSGSDGWCEPWAWGASVVSREGSPGSETLSGARRPRTRGSTAERGVDCQVGPTRLRRQLPELFHLFLFCRSDDDEGLGHCVMIGSEANRVRLVKVNTSRAGISSTRRTDPEIFIKR